VIYHTYGETGIKVSAIGFGGMRFVNQDDVDGCAGLVKAAYDKGISYFDTAPGYGKSEDLFGVAIKEMSKTRGERPFYIATKTSKTEPAEVRRELESSLKRMNLDYVDFYHVWCILSYEEYLKRKTNGVLKEFERLKQEGLIKHICVSTHMTGSDIGKMLADYPFEGMLLGYSAMNFAYRDAGLDAAAKLNRGVVVMNPLGGGIIPKNPDRFEFVKSQPEETVVEGALRFLINDQRITVSLVGFSSIEQLNEAIIAVDGYKAISAETIERIHAGLKESFNELCTACQYCDSCPLGIDIPRMMQSFNNYMLDDNREGRSMELINSLRYGWGIDLESDYLSRCKECGRCEALCTQKLLITQRLKFIRDEVEKFLKAEVAKKTPK